MCWQFKHMCYLYNKSYNIDIVPIYRNRHRADIWNWYQHDIGYPISIQYRPLAGRHLSDIILHIELILGQLCKTEIRPILKSDIKMISAHYMPNIECLLGLNVNQPHFNVNQPCFNVESTFIKRWSQRWFNVDITLMFNVEIFSHFQPYFNVDDQRWFNVDVPAGQ